MRRRRACILTSVGLSVSVLTAVSVFDAPLRLLYNASPSAPIGFYWVGDSAELELGDLVAARVPDRLISLVVERGYLAESVPVVKRIVAAEGDDVCFRERKIYVNSVYLADPLAADSLGRPMPLWKGCGVLKQREFFLAMRGVPASFDSRYFGPIDRSQIIGELRPIWLFGK